MAKLNWDGSICHMSHSKSNVKNFSWPEWWNTMILILIFYHITIYLTRIFKWISAWLISILKMNFLHSCFKWILHVFDNESLNKIQFFLILERHWRHLVKTTVIQLNLQCALLVIRVLDYLCVIISMMPFQYQAKTGFHMCTIQYYVSLPCRLQVIEVVWLPSCFNIAVIINETFVNNMFCISSLDCCIWHSFC